MSADLKKNILAAVDGSDQSLWAIQYVINCFSPGQARITLFHVLSKLPEACWDLQNHPGYEHASAGIQTWASGLKKTMEGFMETAGQILIKAGFPKDDITVKMPERKVGIARDIAFEAQRNYDALVLGRTGVSKAKDILMGSIADKLAGRLSGTPMWIVGGRPDPKNILIAVDNSEGAARAVNYVGNIAVGADIDIVLLNVQRGLSIYVKEYGEQEEYAGVEAQLSPSEKEMETILRNAKERLILSGLKGDRISLKIIKDTPSRGSTIVDQAIQGRCGTIVVGRRGLSRVPDFFMGRVSNKVMRLAKSQAVWVVG